MKNNIIFMRVLRTKYFCFAHVALVKEDKSICENILDEETKKWCIDKVEFCDVRKKGIVCDDEKMKEAGYWG